MVFHAAELAALVVDQIQQTPIVVQCAQAAGESPWKWLVQSVIPVAGGTLIAVWSFVQNRKSELKQWTRNQDAAHEQWIRDQRKIEWKELLGRIADIEREIPILITGPPIHEKLRDIVLDILPVIRSTIFVYSELDASGCVTEWQTFAQYVTGPFMHAIVRNLTIEEVNLVSMSDSEFTEDRVACDELSTSAEIEVRNRLHAFIGKLRDLAIRSLKVRGDHP